MSRLNLVLLFLVWTIAQATSQTFLVGNCRSNLPSYTTISAAVSKVPANSTVLVCPGNYPGQVTITQPLTLKGIQSGDAGQVVISVDTINGLPLTTVSAPGLPQAAPQVLVNNVSGGPVNISDITVDSLNNGVSFGTYVAGIYYLYSSGTLNHVTTLNQIGGSGGFGVVVENSGGAASQAVTVQNGSMHHWRTAGIVAVTDNTVLNLSINANSIDATQAESFRPGIWTFQGFGTIVNGTLGFTGSLSGNFVTGPSTIGFTGINPAGTLTVSKNTVDQANVGIELDTPDPVSVISNRMNYVSFGISTATSSSSASLKGNTITHAQTGIELTCSVGVSVSSNVITDASVGVDGISTGTLVTGTYYNVGTLRNGC